MHCVEYWMVLGWLRELDSERFLATARLVLSFFPEEVYLFSDLVPAPQHLTLERQLNKSVLIGWTAPENTHQLESYHVYVDGVLKVTVKATERTRALVEGVDSTRVRKDKFFSSRIVCTLQNFSIIKFYRNQRSTTFIIEYKVSLVNWYG